MRASIPLALLSAAVVAGFATAQIPPGVTINTQSFSETGLMIRHDGPSGTEVATLPPGTAFSDVKVGLHCPHYPAEGCGIDYWVNKGYDAYTFYGEEFVRCFAGQHGEVGPHENVIHMTAPGCAPAMVEVTIDSLLDSENYHAWAYVEVVGWGTIYHDWVSEHTKGTIPVMIDRVGVEIRINTHIDINNATAPTYQGLADVDIQVAVKFPAGSYVKGGFGCAGTNGVPNLDAKLAQVPVIGQPFTVKATGLPLDPTKPAYGFLSNARLNPPLDLGLFGMQGCELYVYSPIAWPLAKIAGEAEWTLSIPRNLSLVNAMFYQQVFALDEPGVNSLGAVVSNYGAGTIGMVPVFLP